MPKVSESHSALDISQTISRKLDVTYMLDAYNEAQSATKEGHKIIRKDGFLSTLL